MTAALTAFWRATDDGVTLLVKVQPKSRRPGLHGTVESADGPRLQVGVTEAPEHGRANDAVCALIAQTLGVARSAVQVAVGATSREKRLLVMGDPAQIASRLESL